MRYCWLVWSLRTWMPPIRILYYAWCLQQHLVERGGKAIDVFGGDGVLAAADIRRQALRAASSLAMRLTVSRSVVLGGAASAGEVSRVETMATEMRRGAAAKGMLCYLITFYSQVGASLGRKSCLPGRLARRSVAFIDGAPVLGG
ncbi:hypothetical protein O1K_20447 [Xanthomonas fragariae LMG 25863]|nr:hypothetical protein O1K_20447 [Xanthomonas fragariae LMG 25863]